MKDTENNSTQLKSTLASDGNGIRKEIEDFYNQHYTDIFRFIYRRVDERELAADLVGSTFLKALQKSDDFKKMEKGSLKSWIYKIASNEILLHYRSKKVERKFYIEKTYLNEIFEEEPASEALIETLKSALEELPESEYELIQMKYFDRLSFEEISALKGKTEESLRVALYRIRKKLESTILRISKIQGIEIGISILILILSIY